MLLLLLVVVVMVMVMVMVVIVVLRGKTIPVQAWTGPEGSIILRVPDIKTVST